VVDSYGDGGGDVGDDDYVGDYDNRKKTIKPMRFICNKLKKWIIVQNKN
jgi:hypothetical protein